MAFDPSQPRDKEGRWSAVGAYISEDGFKMNEALRQGYEDYPGVAAMDSAINETGTIYDGDLYRGAADDFTESFSQGINQDFLDGEYGDYTESLAGHTITDSAFVSSSESIDIASDFANRGNGMGTIIKIKSKSKSLNVSDVMGEDANWQEEHVFGRGTSFTIKKAYTQENMGRATLFLEVEG